MHREYPGISESCSENGLFIRSGKSQNESFPNFSNCRPEFCPEFCSEFSPNFSRIFRASFRGRRRPEKIHQKSPPFFNAKLPGKHEKNIHRILLESRQSKNFKRVFFLQSLGPYGSFPGCFSNRCVPPCVANVCAVPLVRPVFCTDGRGAVGSISKQISTGLCSKC